MTPAMVEPPYQIVLEDDGASCQTDGTGSFRGQREGGESTGCRKQDDEALYSLLKTVARRAQEKGVSQTWKLHGHSRPIFSSSVL